MIKDNYRLAGLRRNLVDYLLRKGINDTRILDAFSDIPRHWFIGEGFEELAYEDTPFKIGCNQTISQPYTVAFMTDLLEIKTGDRVLEIGTGSGYQAAVLSYMNAKVYTIERQKELYEATTAHLHKIGFDRIRTTFGDGYKGWPRFAPFDKIIVTAGASTIPNELLQQLEIGGHLVIPVGNGEEKTMQKITRKSKDQYTKQEYGTFQFVPFLPGVCEV